MALGVTNVQTNEFTVTWTTHGTNVATYNIEIYQGNTLISNVRDISRGIRSYRFSHNIQVGTEYEVKMFSRSATNATIRIEYFYTITLPAATGSISITNVTPYSFSLSWAHVRGAENYGVNVRQHGPEGTLIHHSYPGVSRANISGLTPGMRYYVKVYASNRSGNGIPREQITYTQSIPPPSMPPNLRVYDRRAGGFSLAWSLVSGADRYVVEVYRASNNVLAWDSRNLTGASVVVTGLIDGVTYNVKLYANNAGGNSTPNWLYEVRAGLARPNNYYWVVPKEKFRQYTITNDYLTDLILQTEFASLRSRINEFRLYKGLSIYSFSNVYQGDELTANLYNQLESAIRAMNPPTPTYGQRSAGSSYAVDVLLNRLRDSLNSIT